MVIEISLYVEFYVLAPVTLTFDHMTLKKYKCLVLPKDINLCKFEFPRLIGSRDIELHRFLRSGLCDLDL